MKFYKFLFYKYYQLAITLGNEGFYPEALAWSLVTLLIWCNIASILIIAQVSLVLTKSIFKFLMGSTVIFWVISFIYWMCHDQYKHVLHEMEKENESVKKQKTIWVIIYSIITVAVYAYVSDL